MMSGSSASAPIELGGPTVHEGNGVTHLSYHVGEKVPLSRQ